MTDPIHVAFNDALREGSTTSGEVGSSNLPMYIPTYQNFQLLGGKKRNNQLMRTTKGGRPFLKDALDLYSTFILSLHLESHKKFFRTFHHSFSIDQATQNMTSLTFSQSTRGPDPREPSRVVTTTTTTTMSMTREMSKSMSQHFMDVRLIETAANLSLNPFKERGVYQLTPKGLHVLERFITKNGINSDQLQPVFNSQPICIKLLHLERRATDDEIIVTQSVITALFRHFVGRQPNYAPPADKSLDIFQKYNERSRGIPLKDVTERAQPLVGKPQQLHKHCFTAVTALDWLRDFTTVVGREEAAEMSAHFVRFGLITLLSDKQKKKNDSAIVFTVRGSEPGSIQGEFRCSEKAIYRITDEGCRLANWDYSRVHGSQDSPRASSNLAMSRSSVDGSEYSGTTAKIHHDISLTEKLKTKCDSVAVKESNTDRLRYILEEPVLRSLFREFMWSNFGDKSLSFWFDVEDLKRKFNTTSSAMAISPAIVPAKRHATEIHHKSVINIAYTIYNTYLAPSSEYELNIDPVLRNEMVAYLEEVITAFRGRLELDQVHGLNSSQVQTLIRLYERCQAHIFHLMAIDSVPKFIKTREFLDIQYWVEDFNPKETGDLNDVNEDGGVYITISAQESERIHRLLTAATAESTSS